MTTSFVPCLLGVTLLGVTSFSLSTGSAQAATELCTFPACAPGTTMSVGDQTITVISTPSLGSGRIDLNISGSIYQVVTSFAPGLTNQGTSSITGKWAYSIAINPGVNCEISSITMDSDPPLAKTITKKIYLSAADLANGNVFDVLTPLSAIILAGQGIQTLYIEDEYTVNPGESLTSFTNDYQQSQVPAPLPALGAGAAFGFSRRLRRRIQQSHKLG